MSSTVQRQVRGGFATTASVRDDEMQIEDLRAIRAARTAEARVF